MVKILVKMSFCPPVCLFIIRFYFLGKQKEIYLDVPETCSLISRQLRNGEKEFRPVKSKISKQAIPQLTSGHYHIAFLFDKVL